ncbi:hypothetical protein CEXT_608221 [Caerostris extrusa]|uniref:Uncharacterized protein n=1 Tax=Caerostris extrusa TaxID=172846 RepID=A0AAV4U2J6_CAEEX|nr:hypothetical protein CEXT_608221 [Caerostris extrusa]
MIILVTVQSEYSKTKQHRSAFLPFFFSLQSEKCQSVAKIIIWRGATRVLAARRSLSEAAHVQNSAARLDSRENKRGMSSVNGADLFIHDHLLMAPELMEKTNINSSP